MREVLEELSVQAAACAATSLWAQSDDDVIGGLDLAHCLEQQAAAIKAHCVRQIDVRGLARSAGRRMITGWVRDRLRLDPSAARALVKLSRAVDRFEHLDRAYSDGDVHTSQAMAVGETLDDLPAEAGAEVVELAETTMIGWAGQLEPAQLRKVGTRILEHVAPELIAARDEAALRREEHRAHRRRAFTLSAPFEGMARVSGCLPVEDAAVVRAALDPLCAPKTDDERSPAQMRADALVEVCRLALDQGGLPDTGGERPQVAVTVDFDVVSGQLRDARLDTGEALSAQAARRVACDAQILPVVLGGDGQVLDVGRARRLATGALRRALVIRDQGCSFPWCDRPPRWCQAHHIKHWADGGSTDQDNLVLLCGHHHRVIHEGHWQVRLGRDKRPEFIPPAQIDADRSPRRNIFHHRT